MVAINLKKDFEVTSQWLWSDFEVNIEIALK